jgi:hypothetical protein
MSLDCDDAHFARLFAGQLHARHVRAGTPVRPSDLEVERIAVARASQAGRTTPGANIGVCAVAMPAVAVTDKARQGTNKVPFSSDSPELLLVSPKRKPLARRRTATAVPTRSLIRKRG